MRTLPNAGSDDSALDGAAGDADPGAAAHAAVSGAAHEIVPGVAPASAPTGTAPATRGEPAGAAAPPDAIAAAGVSRRYGERWIVRDLDLRIARGERVALLGESGVGKSTLLNLLAGLETPDAGTIAIDGARIDTLDDAARARWRRAALGFVFQSFHLLPHLTVAQNVAVPLLLAGRDERAARDAAQAMLARLGVAARADARPGTLSGGEQQRVALARALVHRPSLVLADEPTGNLDPITAHTALELLFEHCAAAGATLLMVTHSAEAAALAQRRLRLTADGLLDA